MKQITRGLKLFWAAFGDYYGDYSDDEMQSEALSEQQLLNEINAQFEEVDNKADISDVVIAQFKERFLRLFEEDRTHVVLYGQAIYDALMNLAEKGSLACFFEERTLLDLQIKKRRPNPSSDLLDDSDGSESDDSEGKSNFPTMFEPCRPLPLPDDESPETLPKEDSSPPPPLPEEQKKSTPRSQDYMLRPLPEFKSSASEDKALDLAAVAGFRRKVNHYLIQFHDDLKAKLDVAAHKKKALDIYKQICKQLKPLLKEPSKVNLEDFKHWFDDMLLKQKKSFKSIPWIWHDVIRPLLVGFLGLIVTLVTMPIRFFMPGVSEYANSFFEKPRSPEYKMFMAESELLFDRIENNMPTMLAQPSA